VPDSHDAAGGPPRVCIRRFGLPTAVALVKLRVVHRAVPHHRVVFTALLSLLLLFLQQENVRHALDHVGARIERSKHSAIELPAGDVCLECELLAAGTSAVPSSLPLASADVSAWIEVAVAAARATFGPQSSYQSRAPPRHLRAA
jgi:hypothetical protein